VRLAILQPRTSLNRKHIGMVCSVVQYWIHLEPAEGKLGVKQCCGITHLLTAVQVAAAAAFLLSINAALPPCHVLHAQQQLPRN